MLNLYRLLVMTHTETFLFSESEFFVAKKFEEQRVSVITAIRL